MENVFETRELTFTTPSGNTVTIREQNGADDDILSNPVEATNLMNLSRFLAGIILKSSYKQGRLTVEEVHNLPVLDRYCIIFNSRIFSLGEEVEFTQDWGPNGGQVAYTQDLREFLFDYSQKPTEEELQAKPNAIPYYPLGNRFKDIEFQTESGKELKFDLLNANGEAWIANLPLEKQTKNVIYMARNLCLKVNGIYEKVNSFAVFSMRDMRDINKFIHSVDPIFSGNTDIENPITGQVSQINILGVKDFFFLGGI